jgi:hypothetical protein
MAKSKNKFSLTIPEEDRSACGRGWEARRNGLGLDCNPYEEDSWQWDHWRTGWYKFKEISTP